MVQAEVEQRLQPEYSAMSAQPLGLPFVCRAG